MSQDAVKISNYDGVGQMAPRPIGYDDGTKTVQPVDATHPLPVTLGGTVTIGSSTGTTVHRLLSAAASVNATNVKAAAATVNQIIGYNASTYVRYLKLYNKASAPSDADTPTHTIALPPSTGFALDLGGFAFATGFGYRLTTAVADNDTGALTAGDIVGLNICYT